MFNAEHQRLYAQLRAYEGYFQNPNMLTAINRVKSQMLKLKRRYTQNFIRINETLVAGKSMSIFQLSDRHRKRTTLTELQEQMQDSPNIEQHLFRYFRDLHPAEATRENGGDMFETERGTLGNDDANTALMAEIH